MSMRRLSTHAVIAAAVAALAAGAAAGSGQQGRQESKGYPSVPRSRLKGSIAYSKGGAIWVMRADDTGRLQITHPHGGEDFDPSFSPDGKRIVFRTSRGHYVPDTSGSGAEGIFVVDVRTGRETEIEPKLGGLFPVWSPTADEIALTARRATKESLIIVRPDGSLVRDLQVPTSAAEASVWSPDGRSIAYAGHDGDGNWAVWVAGADGSNARQLTFPTLVEPRGSAGESPEAWSPDGRRILYGSAQPSHHGLYTIPPSGVGAPRKVTGLAMSAPAWLPDGHIVVARFKGNAAYPTWLEMGAGGRNIRSLPSLGHLGDPIDWWWPRH